MAKYKTLTGSAVKGLKLMLCVKSWHCDIVCPVYRSTYLFSQFH